MGYVPSGTKLDHANWYKIWGVDAFKTSVDQISSLAAKDPLSSVSRSVRTKTSTSVDFVEKDGKCHNDIANTTKIVHNNGRNAVLFTFRYTHPL